MPAIFALWKTNGEPAGKLRELNPNIPADRRIKQFRFVYRNDLWADLSGHGRGHDMISIVTYLADVDRETAGRFLEQHLADAAKHRPLPPQIQMPSA